MRLIDQFRVVGPDGTQHTIACYHGDHESSFACDVAADGDEFRMNGAQCVARIDADTFVTAEGNVLRRVARRANGSYR